MSRAVEYVGCTSVKRYGCLNKSPAMTPNYLIERQQLVSVHLERGMTLSNKSPGFDVNYFIERLQLLTVHLEMGIDLHTDSET